MNVFDIPALASSAVLRALGEAVLRWQTAALEGGMPREEMQALLAEMRPELEAYARDRTRELVLQLLEGFAPDDLGDAMLEMLRQSAHFVAPPDGDYWSV